jgi:predicted O-linked N-acetylglucosamine transferase (SPINDLY family)
MNHQGLRQQARKAHQAGDLPLAETHYRQLLAEASSPDPQVAANLGALLRRLGRLQEAEQHYRWALEACPADPLLLTNACNLLRQLGQAQETIQLLHQGLALWPGHRALVWGLALSHHHSGQPKLALEILQPLAQQNPGNFEVLLELGACLAKTGDPAAGLAVFDQAAQKAPGDGRLLANRITLSVDLGQFAKARALLDQAPKPFQLDLLGAEANLLMAEQQAEAALERYRELTQRQPEIAEHWLNLAGCQKALKQMVAPLQTLERAYALHPGRSDLAQGLGTLLADHGRWGEALPLLLAGAEAAGARDIHHFNLQFTAAAARLVPASQLEQKAQAWENSRGLQPAPLWADHLRDRNPQRRLRVIYLSQDFNNHPVGRFIEPVLEQHDRTAVEVVGVACGPIQDAVTKRLQNHCDQWLDLRFGDDLASARTLAELEPDLLVELGGYTGGHRLRLLTAKPAPIQLSYLGYFASTFLSCIDGWIGDPVLFPPGLEREAGGQALHRLRRCYMAYQGDGEATIERRAVDPRFRFGCFNHSRKLSDPCLDLFTAVLEAVPESLLVLKSQSFVEIAEQNRILDRLQQRGVGADRVEILPWVADAREHLELYGCMDVALDPIPYGGATTTAEALWMGVPVLALAGEGMVGRLAASVLAGAGLGSAIARDPSEYLHKAQAIARQGARFSSQRQQLREHLLPTALLDGRGLAAALEDLYRRLWQDHGQLRGT